MTTYDKRCYAMALLRVQGLGPRGARDLLDNATAEELFSLSPQELIDRYQISPELAQSFQDPEPLTWAKSELEFVDRNNIEPCTLGDPAYPPQLIGCPDAPALLYYKGENLDYNAPFIAIVGTRKASRYGQQLVESFIHDLAVAKPTAVIVSGLAYGIDIMAHRAALNAGLRTVGVLAHGFDRIYPAAHRATAAEVLRHGGLLTEYPSGTSPERYNFLARNRIVAGICDATIVVESNFKGGSLSTARLARSYGRELFAFPGRTTDASSAGCNALIRSHKAEMITSAADFLDAMGWADTSQAKEQKQVTEPQIDFLSPEEEKLYEVLASCESMHVDQLSLTARVPVYRLSAVIFQMEMRGLVELLPGSHYRLIR